MLHDKKGREILTGDDAARRFEVTTSYIHKLWRNGELRRVVESPRRIFYYADEVARVTREKAKAQKKRGGRPRKSSPAA